MNSMLKMESIAVASNPVTSKTIAEKLGLSENTVRHCLSKNVGNCSQKTIELVRKTAEEMGYDPKKAISETTQNVLKARWANKTRKTQKQIAEVLGISIATVSKALRGQGLWVEQATKCAKEIGYINPSSDEAKAKKKAEKEANYLLTHNFPSKEAETRRMLYLQSQGYSNKDIGKTIGRCAVTVRRRIGAQPADVTKANRAYGQKLRAEKNAHRRLTAANHTVNVYNEIVTELEELKNRTNVLETKIEEIKPKLKDALKIATVEPMTISSDNNLANAEPTVIQ